MSTIKIEISGLDVWGNADDGYEINDVYAPHATIEIDSECTDAELIKALIETDVLYPGEYALESFAGGLGEIFGNIEDPKTGRPICEIRTIDTIKPRLNGGAE